MSIQTIIFDLDGVLADSEPLWTDIDAAFLRRFDIIYRGEHKLQIMGKSFPLSSQFYKEQYNLPQSIAELVQLRIKTASAYYATEIDLFPDASKVLSQLQAANLQIGLATSSVHECALPLLNRHDIKKYFSAITTGDEVERGKPYPDIYLCAADKLQIKPANALVVEDSPAGVEAAKNAGMQVVAIPDTNIPGITQLVKDADYFLEDIAKLPLLVESLT